MRYYTPQEDDFLCNNYLTIPTSRMSKMLGRSKSSARQRLKLLGIEVPAEVALKFKSANRFKREHVPFNTGKKQSQYMSSSMIEKTAATRFKKGSIPTNHRPVGSERISKDGYIEIKIADPNKWDLKHRVVFGKVPKGMLVKFKDGNPLNCDRDNLYLSTRVENMEANTYHNYPKELANLIQLGGALTRQINKHSKKFHNEK
jgi:hypothetical protein